LSPKSLPRKAGFKPKNFKVASPNKYYEKNIQSKHVGVEVLHFLFASTKEKWQEEQNFGRLLIYEIS